MSEAIWTTRDGTEIPIRKMEDRHLANAIRMVRRAHEAMVREGITISENFDPDMGSFALDQEIDRMEEEGPRAVCEQYDELMEEAGRRGLKV